MNTRWIPGPTYLLSKVIHWSIGVREAAGDEVRENTQVPANETHVNGVASWARPCIAPALPAKLSTNMPIVIRDGKACGLIMTSGCIPLSLKGISIMGNFCEQTPF